MFNQQFKTIRNLFANRFQRFAMCTNQQQEQSIREEEIILGSKERAIELGNRYLSFENDEVFLEEALTYLYIQKKLRPKATYTFEEVVDITKEAMGERNNFLRLCAKNYKDTTNVVEINY